MSVFTGSVQKALFGELFYLEESWGSIRKIHAPSPFFVSSALTERALWGIMEATKEEDESI